MGKQMGVKRSSVTWEDSVTGMRPEVGLPICVTLSKLGEPPGSVAAG